MTDTHAPAGLMDAFWEYERALMADDVATLDRLFAPGEHTLRGDANGLLVGHDAISRFRGARGGAPQRRVVDTYVQVVDATAALVVAVTELLSGGRGQQTQLWVRRDGRWVVSAAHVAVSPPALDRRVWRVVGDPLVPAVRPGPLDGESVAVKDLYAVAGQRVGAGNPAWLDEAPVEVADAWAVARLREAGASVRGLARTDELAYSLAGTNAHYGTPPNPRAPHRVSGGSTSGSASAVSLGHATVGLGTDTGGSIRVPAAYQGLFGLRTTHDAVPRSGLVPLAPSFDTVGWLTRDAERLRAVGRVLLPADTTRSGELVVAPQLLGLADADVAEAVGRFAKAAGARPVPFDTGPLASWLAVFQAHQAAQAWAAHGDRLEGRLDVLGPDVRARFERARATTPEAAEGAHAEAAVLREQIRRLLGDRVLVLPSASSVAPHPDPAALERVRQATMQLTCLAGLGGLPAASVPVETAGGLPAGACLVGPPGTDRALLDLAVALTA